MKRFFAFAFIVCMLSTCAFAATGSKNIKFTRDVTVGKTVLPAGDYKVSWKGEGSSVQVFFEQKNVYSPKTVTVPGKVVQGQNHHTGITFGKKNGASVLQTIHLEKDTDLVIAEAETPEQ